ncbi:hypothetical protein GCM10022199_24610 [Marihabitans asiaticum]|uniref:Putative DCC family thiol-disulfide oxidoreductase YuxK n=1 Tax=Marihabitans asiaticum TaxID=415218 RepID=A0A560W9M2_9MICO|nr:DUF393 domain-containing protein [Marihabitans asiaticum]TWD14318.1 putative DCC family thiol-disulfide oxidoreductase YuxK [Marihabitans asiaticum]
MTPLLVFDGDCGMCTRSARLAERLRASSGDFAVEPSQRLDLPALGLSQEQCDEALQWVAADGTISSAQDAVAQALLAARWFVRPLGAIISLPSINSVAGVVYRWVARNRHLFPGGTPACQLPEH